MPLNDNLKQMLSKVLKQSTDNGLGYIFLNPKNPMVAPLLAQNFMEADVNMKNPADGAQVAVRLTASGLAEIGAAMPAAASVPQAAPAVPQPAIVASPPPAVAFGATPAQQAASDPTAGQEDSVKHRIVPTIARTGNRMAMPPNVRGAGLTKRPETYPFSALEAPIPGQNENDPPLLDSFFVHATADLPNPAKSLAGTVSSATKRYKDQKPPRKFSVIAVEKDHEHGVKGARVLRTV